MDEKKSFRIPVPMVNQREVETLDVLTRRYEKMMKPSSIAKLGKKAGEIIPESLKKFGVNLTEAVSEQMIIKQAIELVGEAFQSIQAQAAKYSVSQKNIVDKVNLSVLRYDITELNQICFARSYEVAKAVNGYKSQDALTAFVGGGITGAVGFWGLPFSIALSTYLFYRAVQSIAMFYGYDVKNDSGEMMIASEVFASALSPSTSESNNELSGPIAKFMLFGKVAAIEQTVKKGWAAMAEHGGEALLLTQIRALANAAAKKALEKTGKANLEQHLFKESLEQIGQKLTQKTIQNSLWIFSAAVGAFIDTAQMNRVLEYADIFYHKRFIIEKEARVQAYFDEEEI